MAEKIGLIAGSGRLPVIFSREAGKKGIKVVGFAVKDVASPALNESCHRVHWFRVGEIKKALIFLAMERIKKIAMLGKFDKSVIFSDTKRDSEALNILEGSVDKSDYGLLDKVTRELTKHGIEVINSASYLTELLPKKGVLTKRKPSHSEQEDISFGFKNAKELARLDIGQTIVVKSKAVVSVEAMEGTNRTIERASRLCRDGFSVVKVSRPKQDMRWDVPVIGPETIALLAKCKGGVLALEENRMFLVEKDECIRIADENNISLVVI